MADDATPENEPGPADPPTAHFPIVSGGEPTEPEATAGETPPATTEAQAFASDLAPPRPVEASPPAGSSRAAFVSGVAGAVIGAVVALGAAWYFDPRAEPLQEIAVRQSALEAKAGQQLATDKALDSRLGLLETARAGDAKTAALDALGERVAKLESAPDNGAGAAALDAIDKRLGRLESGTVGPEAIDSLRTETKAAREDAAKAVALATAASEKAAAPPPAVPPDPRLAELAAGQAALGERIGRLETALAAPKMETRAAPTEVAPKRDDAAQAIAAIALEQRLGAGEPFAAEWAALSRAGADPAALATLKPYADTGVPTATALAAAFSRIAPALAASAAPAASDSGIDGLLDHMRKLVRVRAVGEIPGDDPAALISQIEAALAHGQVASALAIYARLPDAPRAAAGDWAKTASARAATDSAARALREAAIGRLGEARN